MKPSLIFLRRCVLSQEKPHKWEIDWDKYDEEEALERLSRLSDYDTMTPAEIESKMRSIREDPSSLANYEAEDKMQQEIKRANDDGIQLTLGDMQRLGAQVTCSIGPTLKVITPADTPLGPHPQVYSFDKERRLDDIYMDASGMAAESPK